MKTMATTQATESEGEVSNLRTYRPTPSHRAPENLSPSDTPILSQTMKQRLCRAGLWCVRLTLRETLRQASTPLLQPLQPRHLFPEYIHESYVWVGNNFHIVC
jgi:hypothetical protein